MKNNIKLISAAAALAMTVATVAPLGDAFAATTWDGNVKSVTISRCISNVYGNNSNTFNYAIAQTSIPTGASVPVAPTSAQISINTSSTDPTNTACERNTIDFSSMTFDTAGDYTYTITESNSQKPAVYPKDTTHSYDIVFQVRRDPNNINDFVVYLIVKQTGGNKLQDFSGDDTQMTFSSASVRTNIEIHTTTSGNMADLDKCFDYVINFSTKGTEDQYHLSNLSGDCDNPSTVKDGDTIKLKHNDVAIIGVYNGTVNEIPVGTSYTITKSGSANYTTTIDGVTKTTVTKEMVGTDDQTQFPTNNITSIDQHLDSDVSTDAFMNITIYILLAIAGGAGLYYVIKKMTSKKQA